MTYTKGRWYADADGIVRVDTGVFYDTPLKIGSGYIEGAFSYDEATEESKANARLVSAAPDLLEILIEADKIIVWENYGFDSSFQDRVEAAIAKAEGK